MSDSVEDKISGCLNSNRNIRGAFGACKRGSRGGLEGVAILIVTFGAHSVPARGAIAVSKCAECRNVRSAEWGG
eukprot:5241430-Pyramimonas_sp.AAC.1